MEGVKKEQAQVAVQVFLTPVDVPAWVAKAPLVRGGLRSRYLSTWACS